MKLDQVATFPRPKVRGEGGERMFVAIPIYRCRQAACIPAVADPTWSDVAPILDEVIDSLPEELRHAVVQHYLNGESQSAIAKQLDLNQSSVSRS